MKQGEKVRWYLLGMGNEIDLHTPHWHGETVTDGGRNTDVIELLPGSMKTVDMLADNPGTWMFHCHVEDHMEAGMMAVYTIYAPPTRACPLAFIGGDFWKDPEKFTLTVKNTSSKTITGLRLTPEMFLAPQDLRRPFNASGHRRSPFCRARSKLLKSRASVPPAPESVLGWVFFPNSVKYQDGSSLALSKRGRVF